MEKSFFKDLVFETSDSVYAPREDSFLLAGVVEVEARGLVLDVGTGSGIQGICAVLNKKVLRVIAVDVNPQALKDASKNAVKAGVASKIVFRESNLFSNVGEKFDCIVFNPPYLPTSSEEKVKGELNAALDGGVDGKKVLKDFLEEFPTYLKKNGFLLLLSSSVNDNEWVERVLRNKKFETSVVARQKLFFEELIVFKASYSL
ncbi:MAG: HemK2/MTQ2 family protein methyltransferase [Candidatus Micrarchaeota archaeon]